jgi:hypothetical protein
MNYKVNLLLTILFLHAAVLTAQVQVSKEPKHKNGLENKYIRLLDVKINPGDTTLFHIHSTPSVFVHFTNTVVCSQIKGKGWVEGKNTKGNTSFRSFINDTLVHRVSNCDTVPFHVTDVELLSPYNSAKKNEPMPFPLLFENDRVFAYQLTDSSFNDRRMNKRGPLIAEVVNGEVTYSDVKGRKSTRIKSGKYLYIQPGKEFSFKKEGTEKTLMVLFEIK